MQLRNRLFQHPVLSPYTNDYSEEKFELSINEELTNDGKLVIHNKFSLSEETFQKWIDEGTATFGTFIECTKTSFRKFYRSQSNNITIKIDMNNLIDVVNIQGFILLNEDKFNFYNPNFNFLYGDNTFNLKKHSILGLSQEYKIDIEPQTDAFKTVASIFKVIKQTNLEDKDIDINYQSDFIKVYLSSNRYRQYKEVERLTKNTPQLLHAIIVVPVLNNVLSELKDLPIEEIDFKWFSSLMKTLDEKDKDPFEIFNIENSKFTLANELLDTPTLKSLEVLRSILTVKGDLDEEI